MTLNTNRQLGPEIVGVHTGVDPIEQQILAAGNLSQAQVEAIRGFLRFASTSKVGTAICAKDKARLAAK